jgi:hypothetical protein
LHLSISEGVVQLWKLNCRDKISNVIVIFLKDGDTKSLLVGLLEGF